MKTIFGPLLLLIMGLLTVVLSSTDSIQYALGFASGKLITSVAFALPIYFIVRYGTSFGQGILRREKFNVLCLATALVWIIQIILLLIMPNLMNDLKDINNSLSALRKPENERGLDISGKPANVIGEYNGAPGSVPASSTPAESIPLCKNFFDQTQGVRCRPKSIGS